MTKSKNELILLVFFAAVFAGYARNEIKVYTVAKEKPAAKKAAAEAGDASVDVNSAPVHWHAPESWKELPPTTVRLGNFQVTGKNGKQAEVAITSFPGNVGTELDNWNRWRRELNLDATDEKDVTSEKATVGNRDAKLYDISSETQRTVVAALPKDGSTWFFKLRGDKETVAEARTTFIEFLKTVHFDSGDHSEAQPVAAATDPHANVPGFGASDKAHAQPGAEAEQSEQLPQWTVPSHWTEKPAGMMVVKSFSISGDKGTASVAISVFPGDVGGTFANVNRWRGQMGLPAVAQNELDKTTETLDLGSTKATLVDLKGTDPKTGKPARMVAAILPQGDSTWFYKMTGEDAVVGKEKEGFINFLRSVRYP